MAEECIPISEVTSKIAEKVHSQNCRCVLTNEGVPKAVLLGYDEYSALREAADLWSRPQVIEDMLIGQRQVREGRTIPLEDVIRELAQLRQRVAPLAIEIAGPVAGDRGQERAAMNETTAPNSCRQNPQKTKYSPNRE